MPPNFVSFVRSLQEKKNTICIYLLPGINTFNLISTLKVCIMNKLPLVVDTTDDLKLSIIFVFVLKVCYDRCAPTDVNEGPYTRWCIFARSLRIIRDVKCKNSSLVGQGSGF